MSESYTARGVAYNSKSEADLAAEIPSVYLDRAEDAGFIAEAVIDSEWLREHDAEVAHSIAARIRQNCTVPTDALNKAGDYIVYAVADWIDNPPEWVNAPWVAPVAARTDVRP